MSTSPIVTLSDEKATLSILLHSYMLNTLFLGIYTPSYFGTLYIYILGIKTVTRKSSISYIVLAAITVLYVINVIGGLMFWSNIHSLMGVSGESKSTSLWAGLDVYFGTKQVLLQVVSGLPLVVTDGLLIWRCFKLWNSSLRIISPSLILFVSEIALFLAEFVLSLLSDPSSVATTSNLGSAGLFIALALTIWTTLLITYRIYSASKDVTSRDKLRFRNLLAIITESSFLYSLVLVANALLAVIPLRQSNIWKILSASAYLYVITSAITGLAPTVMVARITFASDSYRDTEPAASGVSDIQLGEQNPDIQTGEGIAHNTEQESQATLT